jgi:putative Mn2+ efflux pump MntP
MLATLLLVGASLGLDNFAAAIAIGISGVDRRLRTRVALVFGTFEAGMPIVGLLIGRGLSNHLGSSAHLVGGGLLIAAGAEGAIQSWRASRASDMESEVETFAAVRPVRLVVLAAALSIDNLIVGFALGADRAPLALSVVVIGLVSVGMSLVGLELGARLSQRIGRYSELFGAAMLVLVGVALAVQLI